MSVQTPSGCPKVEGFADASVHLARRISMEDGDVTEGATAEAPD